MRNLNALLAYTVALAFAFIDAWAAPSGQAARIIDHLRMEKIPDEGAWFAGTYRSDDVLPANAISRYAGAPRVGGSAIYALVTREDFSAMHQLKTDEIWHYYGGDPLELLLLHPDGRGETLILGPDVLKGQHPQILVRHGVWQGARPIGGNPHSYTFFGCTLTPGFEYGDFTIGYRDELQKAYPKSAVQIAQLTRNEFATRPPAAAAPVQETAAPRSDVFTPADVAKIDVAPGIELRELAGRVARIRSDDYSVALFTLAPGQSMPTSYNRTSEEIFLVTSGEGQVTLDRETRKVSTGSIVLMKPEVRHSIAASPGSTLSFYAVSAPAFSPDDHVLIPQE